MSAASTELYINSSSETTGELQKPVRNVGARLQRVLISDQRRIIREIARLHAKREPLNLSAVKKCHPELMEAVYAVRPFWGWKQALEDAGISYDKIHVELQDACTCLVCGEEAGILTSHLTARHQLTPKEYSEEFPGVEIMAETVRAARMRGKAAIAHWEPAWSWEYVLDRAWEFHRRGWSLSSRDIQCRERGLFGRVWSSGRQWDDVLAALGLNPNEIRKAAPGQYLSSVEVIGRLKRRFKNGKSVAEAKVCREDLRLNNAARRRFGSYAKALVAAGFEPDQVRLKIPKYEDAHLDALRADMKRVASLPGYERAKAAQKLKERYKGLVFHRLGNWRKACRKFGVEFKALAVSPFPTKEDVLHELRRQARKGHAGITLMRSDDHALRHAVYRLFGSWMKVKRLMDGKRSA